ncbi:MAG: transglycosylase SLT domain-containing protein [Bacteroidaceae bacterium]|nr:transglycosylase SLT domain-containing protein [Bacteroidaceae bacterium]
MRAKITYPIILITIIVLLAICSTAILAFKDMSKGDTVEEEIILIPLSPYVTLSPYDVHFRKAAEVLDYDWTLIAAIAYTESRFDSTAISEVGALGVMQMMPKTLEGMGFPDSLYMEPRTNIIAATELIRSLERHYRYIKDNNERLNFVLASYNAGFGHINDAMRLARKHGKNRYKWYGNVDTFLIYKNEPEYYTDTLCRNGQFTGWKETLSFVNKVHRNWKRFSKLQQQYNDSINIVVTSDRTKIIKE